MAAIEPSYKKEPIELRQPDYNEKEVKYRGFLIERMEYAKTQRDDNYIEFDDMDYLTYHETNAKAGNSYLRSKQNDEDVRIVTGTTLEKENTLLSSLLNYNLEPNIVAFDRNNLAEHSLGETMEDLIKKSREIEDYDTKRQLIYKEALDQGTVFVEERWDEWKDVRKELKDLKWKEGAKIDSIKWTERLEKVQGMCTSNLLSGVKVYLGNIRQFHIQKQPFLFIVDYIPYEEIQAVFQDWERWEHVSDTLNQTTKISEDETDYVTWYGLDNTKDMVEIIKYQDKWNNEFQIFLNGVMMLPVGFPLQAISPSGEYTIAKGDIEPISGLFAYSKSIPAKTKVDQAVYDEFLRLMILKTQQSFKPPMANSTGNVLSKNIFLPGTITPDVDVKSLVPLIPTPGVTAPEFNAVQFVKGIIDEKSVSPVVEGQALPGKQTATEIVELKRQGMMKLGLVIVGIMNLERQLSRLRLHNILANWTEPMDERLNEVKGQLEKFYRTETIDTTFEEGETGKKIIDFTTDEGKLGLTSDQVLAEEELVKRLTGENVKKVYINPDELKSLDYNWFITITPTEKDSNELDRVLFMQNVAQGLQMFGPQAFNMEYLKEQWAIKNKMDPDKVLIKGAMMPPMEGQAMEGQATKGAGVLSQGMTQPMRSQVQQPSVNTLAK